MSSARFPGFELGEWRSRLIDRFPRLFPDARPIREQDFDMLYAAGWPTVEDGWRQVVDRLCRRLDAVAERVAGTVVVIELDEKHAELRVNWSCAGLSAEEHAEVQDIVERAEARSSQTCGICGERGAVWEHRGWLSARCPVHAEGLPNGDAHPSAVRLSFVTRNGRTVRIARLYVYDRDAFVEIDRPLETA